MQKATLASPYGLGFYGSGDGVNDTGGAPTYSGEMVATDWQGNIYIVDPTNQNRQWLRQYNKRGQFIQKWSLSTGEVNYSADVTRSGIVWVSVEQGHGYHIDQGLPFLAFRSGQQKAIVDWRKNSPPSVDKFIQFKIGKTSISGYESQSRTYGWNPNKPECILDAVYLRVDNNGPSTQVPQAVKIRLNIETNDIGKVVKSSNAPSREWKDIKKSKNLIFEEKAVDGSTWYFEPDESWLNFRWQKVWFWRKGSPKGQPIVTLQELLRPSSWWQRTFNMTKRQRNPGLEVDGAGNIYQKWTRDSNAPPQTFQLGDGPHLRGHLESEEGEKALVVLDPKRQIIGYLPWRTSYWELVEKWIAPVPDGSGFYRQEFGEKELRIYWHPLPNFKPAAPKKASKRKR